MILQQNLLLPNKKKFLLILQTLICRIKKKLWAFVDKKSVLEFVESKNLLLPCMVFSRDSKNVSSGCYLFTNSRPRSLSISYGLPPTSVVLDGPSIPRLVAPQATPVIVASLMLYECLTNEPTRLAQRSRMRLEMISSKPSGLSTGARSDREQVRRGGNQLRKNTRENKRRDGKKGANCWNGALLFFPHSDEVALLGAL